MLLTARPAVLFSVKCPTLHLREKHIDTLGTSLIGTDSFSSEVDQSEQQSLMLWGLDLRVGCRRRYRLSGFCRLLYCLRACTLK